MFGFFPYHHYPNVDNGQVSLKIIFDWNKRWESLRFEFQEFDF